MKNEDFTSYVHGFNDGIKEAEKVIGEQIKSLKGEEKCK